MHRGEFFYFLSETALPYINGVHRNIHKVGNSGHIEADSHKAEHRHIDLPYSRDFVSEMKNDIIKIRIQHSLEFFGIGNLVSEIRDH